MAQGESVKGYGRIELYINGKLFHNLAVSENFDLLVGACSFEGKKRCDFEHEKNFYPCLGKMPSANQIMRKTRKQN